MDILANVTRDILEMDLNAKILMSAKKERIIARRRLFAGTFRALSNVNVKTVLPAME